LSFSVLLTDFGLYRLILQSVNSLIGSLFEDETCFESEHQFHHEVVNSVFRVFIVCQ
jgi:hypothetical protein